MFTLIYIFILFFIVPIAYCYVAENQFLDKIVMREKLLNLPCFTIGRRLSAFTVEKSYVVQGSVVLTMNFLRRFKLLCIRMIYGATTSVQWLIDMAQREALLRLKESATGANYVVNLKFSHAKTNNHEIEVLAYGTAIQLYPDTLGIYFLPEIPRVYHPITKKSSLLKNFLAALAVIVASFIGTMYVEKIAANSILEHFGYNEENTVWNYLKNRSDVKQTNFPEYLKDAQTSLDAIITSIPKPQSPYTFKVILVDTENTDFILLPNGNMLLHKGLLRKIKTENELSFLFSIALESYKNKNHIENMGEYITTPYVFLQAFGDDSFIAEWVVRLYPFDNIIFTDQQTLATNKAALATLNKIYGHVGGIELFANDIANTDAAERNFIAPDLLKEAQLLKLELQEPKAISFVLDQPQIVVKKTDIIPAKHNNEDFRDLIPDFIQESSKLINKYQSSMAFMSGLMDGQSLGSKDSIQVKLSYIDYGFENITYYDKAVNSLIEDYANDVKEILEHTADDSEKRIISSIWQTEVDKFHAVASFYLKRDYEILNTQQGALNFLNNRIGKYSVDGGRVIFRLKNDQDSYDGLMDRIFNLYSKQSPQTTNKGRK